MGTQSIVSGYINIIDRSYMDQTRETIASHEFDDVWPFPNIFWCDSPARFHGGVVGIAGSFKQIEEVWREWLWKFTELLTKLEAVEARVTLDCIMGHNAWRLLPRAQYEFELWVKQYNADPEGTKARLRPPEWPKTMIGQRWGVVEAPSLDFSIDSDWHAVATKGVMNVDPASGEQTPYRWDKIVEHWFLNA